MTTNDNELSVRHIRIGPGVRDAVRRDMESRPESPRAREAREDRAEYERFLAEMREECIHPGLFSQHVPGDPDAFNATEHCWECGADVPAGEL